MTYSNDQLTLYELSFKTVAHEYRFLFL
jgi:hypothetical protein